VKSFTQIQRIASPDRPASAHGQQRLCRRPTNIVFILSDDQAWSDYGFMGHADIKTPHLDKLASSSLFFDRGYVAAPICRPSLASMVTGLFPHQHGVTGNDVAWGPDRSGLLQYQTP
jgi:arylsulfatase A-like enzyme